MVSTSLMSFLSSSVFFCLSFPPYMICILYIYVYGVRESMKETEWEKIDSRDVLIMTH